MPGSRRLGIFLLGLILIGLQGFAVLLIWIGNDLAGVDGEGGPSAWVDALRSVLMVALAAMLVCLVLTVRGRLPWAWWTYLALVLASIVGAWLAFVGPLDAVDVPILLTVLSVPLLAWQAKLMSTDRSGAGNVLVSPE